MMSQLPYSADQPQFPLLPLGGMNKLPPPPIEVSDHVRPWLADIATMAANEIQTAAQQNPNALRIFMFNQMAVNNFSGMDFQVLVAGICDFLAVQIYQTNNPNAVGAKIQEYISQLVSMYAARNAAVYPELYARLQPQQQMDVQNLQRSFEVIGAQVTTMKTQIQQRMQPNMGGMGGMGNPQAARLMSNYVSPFGNMPGNAPVGGGMGGMGSTGMMPSSGPSMFNTNQPSGSFNQQGNRQLAAGERWSRQTHGTQQQQTTQQPPVQQQQTTQGTHAVEQPFASSTRWGQGSATPAASVQEAVDTARAAAQESSEPILIPAKGNENLWRPSEDNPYLPAYDPNRFELFFKSLPDGTLKPTLKKKEPPVDYDRHSTKSIFGQLPKPIQPSQPAQVMEKIDAGVTQLNKDLASVKDDQYEKYKATHVKKTVIAEISEESAIFVGTYDRLASNNGDIPNVYRAYARVATPIISFDDDEGAIRKFAECKTFAELREDMMLAVESMSQYGWLTCHNKITGAINRGLRQNLSLPALSIDSFVDDIGDLVTALGNRYGGAVQEAFLKHQGDVIKATFQLMYEDSAEQMTAVYKGETQFPDNMEPRIAYLSSDLSLTYLNCLSHELDLDMIPMVAATVTEDLTPLLYKVVSSLFKDVRSQGNDFDRHLIITNDGRQLEATTGWLGQDFFLVTVAK